MDEALDLALVRNCREIISERTKDGEPRSAVQHTSNRRDLDNGRLKNKCLSLFLQKKTHKIQFPPATELIVFPLSRMSDIHMQQDQVVYDGPK